MDHKLVKTSSECLIVKKLGRTTKRVIDKKSDIVSFLEWIDVFLISKFGNTAIIVFCSGDISCVHSEIEYIGHEKAYHGYLVYSLVAVDFVK